MFPAACAAEWIDSSSGKAGRVTVAMIFTDEYICRPGSVRDAPTATYAGLFDGRLSLYNGFSGMECAPPVTGTRFCVTAVSTIAEPPCGGNALERLDVS